MTEVQIRDANGISASWQALVIQAVENALRLNGEDPSAFGVTVVLTDDAEMQRLNLQFRGIDAPTDVLSFEASTGDDFLTVEEDGSPYLGDIIVSLDRVLEQAAASGHSPEYELAILTAHGTLHLLGLDHVEPEEERHMWSLQEQAAREAVTVEPEK